MMLSYDLYCYNSQFCAGYMSVPQMPQMMPPPGAHYPGQMNGHQGQMTAPPPLAPGSAGIQTSGAMPMFPPPPPPPMYQGNVSLPTDGGNDGSNTNDESPSADQ